MTLENSSITGQAKRAGAEELELGGLRERRLAQAMEQYLVELESGRFPDPLLFAAQFSLDIADSLNACLTGLEFVHRTAPTLADGRAVLDDSDLGSSDFGPNLGQLGDFLLLREIGRGGMGVVYEAEQISLNRRVAVKVLPFAAVMDSKRLQRFRQEAYAAAALRHSNIVTVHCVGCERGVYHYAMDYIDGQSLANLIAQLRHEQSRAEHGTQFGEAFALTEADTRPTAQLPTHRLTDRPSYFRWVSRLTVHIARAVHFAHEQGIIHRDLKPSNLLLDKHGNPWVTDFGLAQVSNDHVLTMTGDLLGTLRYMSPEQAEGKKLLDPRTDIYSLGATLYELLTLLPPLDGEDRQQLLRQIDNQEPRLPRCIEPKIPRDLETIVLKSLAKEPTDRYDTAADFAEDLQRFLDDKPIAARRTSQWRRLGRWISRHRLVTILLTLLFSSLLIGAIAGPVTAIRFARLAEREKQSRELAERNRRELAELLSGSLSQTTKALELEPQLYSLRVQLMVDAVSRFEKLHTQSNHDAVVTYGMAIACYDLARVHYNFGKRGQARRYDGRAADLLARLCRIAPSNLDYQIAFARSLTLSSELALESDAATGQALAEQSVQVMEQTLDHSPFSWKVRSELCLARVWLAKVLMENGEADAAALFHQVKTDSQMLADRFPENHDYQSLLAYCKAECAIMQIQLGQITAAETELRQSQRIYSMHASGVEQGWVINLKVAAAECDSLLGAALIMQHRFVDAEVELRRSIAQLEGVIDKFCSFQQARVVLTDSYLRLSDALRQQERSGEARDVLLRCLQNYNVDQASNCDLTEMRARIKMQLDTFE